MKSTLMKFFVIAVIFACLICLIATSSWSAEKYPSRSIELVCGSTAGGATDVANRLLAKYFEKYLKVPFAPMNKPGPSQMMMASVCSNFEAGWIHDRVRQQRNCYC